MITNTCPNGTRQMKKADVHPQDTADKYGIRISFKKGRKMMKRVLSILLCVMLVGSLFAMAISANAAEEDNAALAAPETIAAVADDNNATVGDNAEPVQGESIASTDIVNGDTATVVTETVAPTGDTAAATTAETIAPTTAATTANTEATQAATEATNDQAAKKAATPKTGDNVWLWIGIGIFGVALVAIIITFVVKKKAK